MDPAYARRYRDFEEWHWWFRGRQRIIAEVLRRELPAPMGLTIASLGCGPAGRLAWLRAFAGPGGRVLGLDVDPNHAHPGAPGVHYLVGDLQAAPLASGSVDVVLAFDVLEHLEDDSAGLREAARLCRRGGRLVVTVPAWPSLWGAQDVVSHHRRRYTRRTLQAAFARAELPRPRLVYFNTLLFPAVAALRLARRLRPESGQARSDFELNRRGLANDVLAAVFALERHIVPRVPLPLGASLLALARPT